MGNNSGHFYVSNWELRGVLVKSATEDNFGLCTKKKKHTHTVFIRETWSVHFIRQCEHYIDR